MKAYILLLLCILSSDFSRVMLHLTFFDLLQLILSRGMRIYSLRSSWKFIEYHYTWTLQSGLTVEGWAVGGSSGTGTTRTVGPGALLAMSDFLNTVTITADSVTVPEPPSAALPTVLATPGIMDHITSALPRSRRFWAEIGTFLMMLQLHDDIWYISKTITDFKSQLPIWNDKTFTKLLCEANEAVPTGFAPIQRSQAIDPTEPRPASRLARIKRVSREGRTKTLHCSESSFSD